MQKSYVIISYLEDNRLETRRKQPNSFGGMRCRFLPSEQLSSRHEMIIQLILIDQHHKKTSCYAFIGFPDCWLPSYVQAPLKVHISRGLLLRFLVRLPIISGSPKLWRVEEARPFRFLQITVAEDVKPGTPWAVYF